MPNSKISNRKESTKKDKKNAVAPGVNLGEVCRRAKRRGIIGCSIACSFSCFIFFKCFLVLKCKL